METIKIFKVGGNVIENSDELSLFLNDFSKISEPKILIHGGGKLATQLATKMGIPTKMIDGRRLTDADTLDIITMVYAGKINKNIVAKLQALDNNAIGMTGADGNIIVAEKRPIKQHDYGYVGDVTSVNATILTKLLELNIIPVLCAISHDQKGQLLNTNADTIAAQVAAAISQYHPTNLYYCFEKKGVLQDVDDDNSVIPQINTQQKDELIQKGIIIQGMIPKIDNCFYALNNGVQKVYIGNTDMVKNTNNPTATNIIL